ncbi:hypothetical protein ACI1MP_37840 (plasmid) [Kitasatospora griseola]|uniref:hypothetical protein n=1 Tax=Kitasatospora griseola TaxID=2064 RepID=UPI0038560A38
MTLWTPLSFRDGGTVALRAEVSATLERPLRDWLYFALCREGGELWQRVALRCDLVLEAGDGGDESDDVAYEAALAYGIPTNLLLEAVDAALDLLPVPTPVPLVPARRAEDPPMDRKTVALVTLASMSEALTQQRKVDRAPLQQLLDDARSRYTVRADGRALVARVDPALVRALEAAVESGEQPERGSASEHLQEAFERAYAFTPDPVKAFSEAIKAVECAAHSTLQPNHRRATLGTMLGEMSNLASALVFEIEGADPQDGVEMVRLMMRQLWDGQTSRHGKKGPTRKETEAQAVAAVHLAAVLVQWFSSGAIRRA